ncbi:12 days embryo spinal ganglion cDNA [Pelomyxa schiedti]|nr:12 days embryo spinal ganglion cDNA [Pelomyxa schiedti]
MASTTPVGAKDFDWAVKNGDLAGVKGFVTKSKALVNMLDANKRTPMHWSADYGQLEIAQYLFANGARVDERDRFGITPLLAAVYAGHENMVQFLLSKKANKTIRGMDGRTPLEAAETESMRALLR